MPQSLFEVELARKAGYLNEALLRHAEKGDVKLVRACLDEGADPNYFEDNKRLTALHLATIGDHSETVALLIERGADIDFIADDGWTAFVRAAYIGHIKVIELLVASGVNIHTIVNRKALAWAAEMGDLPIVRFLLEQGANIHLSCDPLNGLAFAWIKSQGELAFAWANSQSGGGESPNKRAFEQISCLLMLYGLRIDEHARSTFMFHSEEAQRSLTENTDEYNRWTEMRSLLEQGEIESQAYTISIETQRRWIHLLKEHPELYEQLADLSPRYHQLATKFGAPQEACWGAEKGMFTESAITITIPDETVYRSLLGKTPAIRLAAIDYLKKEGKTFDSLLKLRQAINKLLSEHVKLQPNGEWAFGALQPYWDAYSNRSHAFKELAFQMFVIIAYAFDNYRDPALWLLLEKIKEDMQQDPLTLSCGLPGNKAVIFANDKKFAYFLNECIRFSQWAADIVVNERSGIFCQKAAFYALLEEAKALETRYKIKGNWEYFFNDYLKNIWEADKDAFEGYSIEQCEFLVALAKHAGLEKAFGITDGFDAKAEIKTHWDALRKRVWQLMPSISSSLPRNAGTVTHLYSFDTEATEKTPVKKEMKVKLK